ncbi:hypothetical protein QPK24_11860 [Paenibacillus polygoni]|uniref:Intracellular septation protein A n=1 Tax=Paenibacillus polygoni TaxID=3050112 RepID=A0ABY8X6Z5_9BACL|nr:hypothetical protein [Paenibacillus polygoni]WIV21317.1 hypothetical protein QPK24_11860 [Paenibacillus polygoni]
MILTFIIACEIGFWIFVLGGLCCRYVLQKKRLGNILLFGTPVIDLALLVATVISLQNGAQATTAHALAAVYIGVSIGLGHRMIKWMDQRFMYWFAKGPKPQKKYGKEHARDEIRGFAAHLVSWMIGCLLLYGMMIWINNEVNTEPFRETVKIWSTILIIDLLISASYTLWPRLEKESKTNN